MKIYNYLKKATTTGAKTNKNQIHKLLNLSKNVFTKSIKNFCESRPDTRNNKGRPQFRPEQKDFSQFKYQGKFAEQIKSLKAMQITDFLKENISKFEEVDIMLYVLFYLKFN